MDAKTISSEDVMQPLFSPFPFLKCYTSLDRYRRHHAAVTVSFLRLPLATTRVVVFMCISACVCMCVF